MSDEKKQKMIWNFDNALPEEEQIKRIDKFNNLAAEIGVNYYMQNKSDKK